MSDVATRAGYAAEAGTSDPGQRPTIEVTPRIAVASVLLVLSIIGGWLTASIVWGWSVGAVVLCTSSYFVGVVLLL